MSNAVLFASAFLLALGYLSPVVAAFYLAAFRGKGVAGRWLFLVAGPAAAYTIVWILTLVFTTPAYLILVYMTPAVKQITGAEPYWMPVAVWISRYDFLIGAVICAVLALWQVRYLWPRWPGVFAALAATSKKESPPAPPGAADGR